MHGFDHATLAVTIAVAVAVADHATEMKSRRMMMTTIFRM
jgi:hypothetical protein